MKKHTWFVLILALILLLTACTPTPQVDPTATVTAPPEPTRPPTTTVTTPPEPTPTETAAPPLSLEDVAEVIINALAEDDLATVAGFVHPVMGVRFSPYTYVEDEHLVFMSAELPGLFDDETIFLWGVYDGIGDPIELTFTEYYAAFVYSADFAKPEAMAVNEELGWSSMINNIADFYPGSSFVEFHFSGFVEEYGGLDWASLRLVFLEENGVWFLVGIVNDQWTI